MNRNNADKLSKKASIWGNIGAIILILIFALIILLIISPGFREIFLGFSAVFGKYDRSEISNSTYYALSAESVGIDIEDEPKCKAEPADSTTHYICSIADDSVIVGNDYSTKYPVVNVFVNIKNDGTKMRTLYAKPMIGRGCDSISKCEYQDFHQGKKKCSIAPQQTMPCDAGEYIFEKEGIYKIYPGYMCEVTSTDGCFEPGATKAAESYNGKNHILIEVLTAK